MLRIIFCLNITLWTVGSSYAQSLNLQAIRKDFNKGVKDEELCKKYLKALEDYADSPEEFGYEAAFKMFMAKHTANPIKKMSYFKSGKNLLDQQIQKSSNNIELRFIRLCIQFHTPSYLGYRDEIEEDKTFLVNNLHKLKDDSTKSLLYNYLKGANMYTDQELELLNR